MPFIIHRKPPYRVYVEAGTGGAMAHAAELPGCFAVGSNAARAAAAAPTAIEEFLMWLRRHREPLVPEAHVSRPSMADLFVAEVRTDGAPLQAGSRAGLFEFDVAAWEDDKVERQLRWLGYSRADLLRSIEGLSEAEMRARELGHERKRGARSLWDTLRHVADAEYGYINRVAGPLEGLEPVNDTEPSDMRERLAAIRAILEKHARGLTLEKRAEVVYPTWASRPDEPWTLPKALRRALEHEREHEREVRRQK